MSSLRGGRGSVHARAASHTRQASAQISSGPGLGGRGRGLSRVSSFNRGGFARGDHTGGDATQAKGIGNGSTDPQPSQPTSGSAAQRFQQLKTRRDLERKAAIRDGFLADPEKPRTLAEAITPVGTCPDMCAEFERVERIVQKDVWTQELDENGQPDESRMVKKFRRAAAGIDEQLPSDLRSVSSLSQTCDYLFNDLIADGDSLGQVHHFVWDRTRAIRNDFSIQQITKPQEVEVAIDCYERIARFHVASLHQFAVPEKPYDKYDWYQEREQLDRTLLSLMQYYDDNRGKVDLKNESEFRAYCIIFQIQDPIPDLEDRVSRWSEPIKSHPRVKAALELYAAACNVTDPQGPLKPRASHPLARQDWNGFFTKVESSQISYLMACVAEIYFNMVRKQTLHAIWRSFRRQGSAAEITDFSLDLLTDLLRFDDFEQTRAFCENFGFGFKEFPDQSDEYLDLNSVQGKSTFPDAAPGLSSQIFSLSVVEGKRMGRTLSAIIRGLSFAQAKREGQIIEEDREMDNDTNMQLEDESSLFIPLEKASKEQSSTAQKLPSTIGAVNTAGSQGATSSNSSATNPTPVSNPFQSAANATNPFQSAVQTSNPFAKVSSSNQASTTPPGSPFGQSKGGLQDSIFAKPSSSTSPSSTWGKPSAPSIWSKPVTSTTDTSNHNPLNASVFGAPNTKFSPTPSITPQVASQDVAPPTSIVKSMHKNDGFSWGKPVAPSWSTPVASKPSPAPSSTINDSNGLPITKDVTSSSTAQPQLGASLFSSKQPSSQSSSIPQQQKELPKFSFGAGSKVTFGNPADQPSGLQSTGLRSGLQSTPAVGQASDTHKPSSSIVFGGTERNKDPALTDVAKPMKDVANPGGVVFNLTPAVGTSQSSASVTLSTQQPTAMSNRPTDMPGSQGNATTQGAQSGISSTAAGKSVPSTKSNQPAPPLSAQKSQLLPASVQNPHRQTSFTSSQPKRRSPLSQSFTAEDDLIKTADSPSTTFKTPQSQNLQQGRPAAFATSSPQTSKSANLPVAADRQTILQSLATEVICDPERGLLRQFVEYHVRSTIMDVFETLYAEEMQQLADKFRQERVARRYGRRWRAIAWQLKLSRQAREKRMRRRTQRSNAGQASEVKRRRMDTDLVDDFLLRQSVRKSNESANATPAASSNAGTSHHSSTVTETSLATDAEMTDMQSTESTTAVQKPFRGRVDAQGRIVKPATPVTSTGTPTRRSHFLGFSLSKQRSVMDGQIPRQSSSAYFRMKALGLNPTTNAVAVPMGPPLVNKKRARDDDDSGLEEEPTAAKRIRTPPRHTSSQSRHRSHSNVSFSSALDLSPGASSIGSVAMSKLDIDEDDVIARARRARQTFGSSTRTQLPGTLHSRRTSVSSPREYSEVQKLQARFSAAKRAEQKYAPVSPPTTADVPAYRLRESRFVPKEHYGRAIEKAQAIISQRSRAASTASNDPTGHDMDMDRRPPSSGSSEAAQHTTGTNGARESTDLHRSASSPATRETPSAQTSNANDSEQKVSDGRKHAQNAAVHNATSEPTNPATSKSWSFAKLDHEKASAFPQEDPPKIPADQAYPGPRSATAAIDQGDTQTLSALSQPGTDKGQLPEPDTACILETQLQDTTQSHDNLQVSLQSDERDGSRAQQQQFVDAVAQQALGLDSSINQVGFQPINENVYGVQGSEINPVRSSEQSDAGLESQIDPSLLYADKMSEATPAPASQDPDQAPSAGQRSNGPSRSISNNPFAALASISPREGSPADDTPMQDRDIVFTEDAEDTDHEDDRTVLLKQPDDETFIPNGVIQDELLPNHPDLQNAQLETNTNMSFSSTAVPLDLMNPPNGDVEYQQDRSTPLRDVTHLESSQSTPASQTRKRKPSLPSLQAYEPPRTRSMSRDVSAPPTPTVLTRSAAREGSQRPYSRNGLLSPSPAEAASPVSLRRSMRKSATPVVEPLPVVAEETAGVSGAEDEATDEFAAGSGIDVQEADHHEVNEDLAKRALAVSHEETEEDGTTSSRDSQVMQADEVQRHSADDGQSLFSVENEHDVARGPDDGAEEAEGADSGEEELISEPGSNVSDHDHIQHLERYGATETEYDDDEQMYDDEGEEEDDEEEEGEEGEEDDEDEEYSGDEDRNAYPGGGTFYRGMTPGELAQSGLVKGGTGTTAEDAFELSD